jgi:DNA repair protein RecO (recombination protein O)
MHMTTNALVLRQVNYKESDMILTLLTQAEGKLTASARGCRKKNSPLAAGCQLLCWSELVLFAYNGRWTVKEAATQRQFRGVRDEVEKLALGCYFAEVTELLAVEGLPCPELLSLILNCLHALDKLDKPMALVKAAFELKALCLAGYEPLLDGCAVCGEETPEQPQFHLREGVLHCARCRSALEDGVSMPLTPAALAAMRHMAYGDPKRLFSVPQPMSGAELGQLGDLTEAYLHTQLERGFRTLDFYKQMTAGGAR